jgi:Molecular chaperone (small heat shock protein)
MYYPSLFNGDFANDLFDEVFNFPVDYGKRLRNEMLDKKRCTTDIMEFDDRYELEMEFPGFDKSEIKAELKNGYLIVSAEHTEKKDTEDEAETAEDAEGKKEPKYICRERFYGKFERSFYVGKDLSKEDIKAQYANGILTLVIPKKVSKPEGESEIISITD